MPNSAAARYRARDGSEHRVMVRRSRQGGWRVLDSAQATVIVETLTDADDGRPQALALACDYAAEQQAFQLDLREDPLARPEPPAPREERQWAE